MGAPSYRDFVRFRTQNPCISGLSQHLERQSQGASNIVFMDYPQNGSHQSKVELLPVTEDDFVEVISATPATITRLLFIENISTQLISLLGEMLDVDPIFFADHVNTNFEDIENAPPPPSLAMLPSMISKRGHLHLHYQQVMDLGSADIFANAKYALKTDSNIPRNIRRLAPLSGRQLALARMCCSLLVKNIGRSYICVILVDPPVTSVVEELEVGGRKAYQAKLLHGGFEDFGPCQSFSSFTSNKDNETWDKGSMLGSLLHYFQTQTPPGFQVSSPSILGLGYYPIRIILAEWNLYMQLTSRYSKYYEYSLRDITNRLHDNDIVDLQRWRRRSKQSRHKLTILADFVEYWMQHEDNQETWNLVLKDINHMQLQLQYYNQSLEQMVTMATSMVQLLDSRRSIVEAINVRRLTYIALVFVPLGWVASLFSMSDAYSPGHDRFWVYFATALSVLGLVLLLLTFPFDRLGQLLKSIWRRVGSRRHRDRRPRTQSGLV